MSGVHGEPTIQPSRVVQPDAVGGVGGSTPGLSYGNLGIFLGGGQTEEFVHYLRNNRHTGDAPSNQPKVAGVFPQRNVGLEVNLSLSPLGQSALVTTTSAPAVRHASAILSSSVATTTRSRLAAFMVCNSQLLRIPKQPLSIALFLTLISKMEKLHGGDDAQAGGFHGLDYALKVHGQVLTDETVTCEVCMWCHTLSVRPLGFQG